SNNLREYLGHPLINIPDFTGQKKNYAEYFSSQAKQALSDWGFDVRFVNSSDLYFEGRYDEYLDLYIKEEDKLQGLLEQISGSRLEPIVSIICQNCGNGKTARWTGINEEREINYVCTSNKQYRGCDFEGSIPIKSHLWKLKWRLDWPARQSFLGVTVEPSGKDHSVAGGSIDTALAIHEELFGKQKPILERYGFITLKGKKFSGSKGGALAANKIKDIMPPSAYLFLVYRNDLLKDISFNPQSMEYPTLMDEFDVARRMVLDSKTNGRVKEFDKLSTAAKLAMSKKEIQIRPADVRYAELTLIHQTSLFDNDQTIKKLRLLNKFPDPSSEEETLTRLPLIERWLDEMAPENIKFSLLKKNPDNLEQYWTRDIITVWKKALSNLTLDTTNEQFTSNMREIAKTYDLSPKEFYPPFYQMLIGKERGPNAANLVLALGKDVLLKRIKRIKLSE
ncbi:MAG: lysine--tRNA ligase, partial [Candidatus Kariarchaeaceae archaeon]